MTLSDIISLIGVVLVFIIYLHQILTQRIEKYSEFQESLYRRNADPEMKIKAFDKAITEWAKHGFIPNAMLFVFQSWFFVVCSWALYSFISGASKVGKPESEYVFWLLLFVDIANLSLIVMLFSSLASSVISRNKFTEKMYERFPFLTSVERKKARIESKRNQSQ